MIVPRFLRYINGDLYKQLEMSGLYLAFGREQNQHPPLADPSYFAPKRYVYLTPMEYGM